MFIVHVYLGTQMDAISISLFLLFINFLKRKLHQFVSSVKKLVYLGFVCCLQEQDILLHSSKTLLKLCTYSNLSINNPSINYITMV
jgi:hypothetical protein